MGLHRHVAIGLRILVAGVLLLFVPGEAGATRTIRYPFTSGSFVIPMDAQQPDP